MIVFREFVGLDSREDRDLFPTLKLGSRVGTCEFSVEQRYNSF